MKRSLLFVLCIFLSFLSTNPVEGRRQADSQDESTTITGRVIRSDSSIAISNSYVLFKREKDVTPQNHHFDVRTDELGTYRFGQIPAGKYTVSISAWFPKLGDVPCQNFRAARTADGGTVTVEWQRKSQEFMETVTIEHFSVEAGYEQLKDFNLSCN